ncbi:hypothetical protein D9V34_01310 [Mycetocola lacteus]|uniref:Uncharacterized protein n=1 Tax=Mycetocola lacteus TaxID=76637 RepID=A0A3L7AN98_9MICO|nr:hypothetical protein [Mycetocola lacteus]RLP80882.1 hypothetical protein D9V34_13605 [Mycetocola lacteus]RLP84667.1 hypothetical protein D9V34_01310 [Mycetocola lacteus]
MKRVRHSAGFSRVLALVLAAMPALLFFWLQAVAGAALNAIVWVIVGVLALWVMAILLFTGVYVSATHLLVVGLVRVTRLARAELSEISTSRYDPDMVRTYPGRMPRSWPRTLTVIHRSGRRQTFTAPVFFSRRASEVLEQIERG